MGCSIPSGFNTMSIFGRKNGSNSDDNKTKLERKLYIARESPEPSFDLSQCALKSVPSGIYSLCRVFRKELLDLEGNYLNGFEDGGSLSDLHLLLVLNISHNRFHKICNEIRFLVNLKELYLNHNQIKYLPESIGDLLALQILDVSNNNLKNLPSGLGKLKRLKKLNISGNEHLSVICNELCNAVNLITIELDGDQFISPPSHISTAGTEQIMRYLCENCGIRYVSPADVLDDGSVGERTPYTTLSPADFDKRGQFANWEAHDEEAQRLEHEMYEASKKQKQRFLLEYTQEQIKIDSELNKIQQVKDHERIRLIRQIQEEEEYTSTVVLQLLEINTNNPLRIQQYLEHDEKEHDRLLEMCRANYTDLRRVDTLKAMQSLLEEECQYEKSLKSYGESQSEVKQSFLIQELTSNAQLGNMLKTRDEVQTVLVERLLKDEDVQKAAVGALLEKCDARTWGLVQEISLVESHLAKLSIIELERRKLELDDSVGNLADQRMKLSSLLVDLLDQQEFRRSQLVDTLQAMELEKKTSSDFWLIRYQQLLDSVPDIVVSSQRQLDPVFANYLLQEGVIHCLPFLVHWVTSKSELASLTDSMLQDRGVRLSADRAGILKAVKFYIGETDAAQTKLGDVAPRHLPSAPTDQELLDSEEGDWEAVEVNVIVKQDTESNTTECVVCMEAACAVVFIPCGHLCCCVKCSDAIEQLCPMCRGVIDRKIRVIQS